MQADYSLFVLAAYGLSALALGGLGLFALWDSRSVRRALDRLESGRASGGKDR